MIKIYVGREIFPIGQKFTSKEFYQNIEFCAPGHVRLFKETKDGRILKFHKAI